MNFNDPQTALEEVFGYEEFRPGQLDVIETVLDGQDLLAIMPTGSGKSLCYQLPAVMREGTALVVSPLIALMKDQLDGMRKLGVSAALINSSLSGRQRRQRIQELQEGVYDIVYVAPERFRSDRFEEAVRQANISLLAIDEAHCVSHWGHDFRPDYLALSDAREMLGEPPVLGLTATATRQVQQDILQQLGLDDAEIIIGGFERPNLLFDVFRASGERAKKRRLTEVLERRPDQSSVVYCATRRQVEDVTELLEQAELVVGTYHGGMDGAQRRETQDAFMAGDLPVLVATNAFGMGVDKPDIRSIIHYNIPGSLEAYYQEAGRAGRDGEPAQCLLLYDPSDRGIHDFFIENSYPKKRVIEAVWRVVSKDGTGTREMSPEIISEHVSRIGGGVDVHSWGVETSLKHLAKGGHLSFGWRGDRHQVTVQDRARMRDLRVDWNRIDEQREVSETHLNDVVNYATGKGCRQAYLLHYFGSSPSFGDQCGRCDSCLDEPISLPVDGRERSRKLPDDPQTVVRKILSGVARTRGYAGRIDMAAMLRGSPAERLAQEGYTELSTFGLLDAMSQHDLVGAVRACEDAELIRSRNGARLELTDVGVEVMTGEVEVPRTLASRL